MKIAEIYNDKGKILSINDKLQFSIIDARSKEILLVAFMEYYVLATALKLFRKLREDLKMNMSDTGGTRTLVPFVISGEVGSSHPDFLVTMDLYTKYDHIEAIITLEDMRVGKCNSMCIFDIEPNKLDMIIEGTENVLNHE